MGRRLGQHFLVDQSIAAGIVGAARLEGRPDVLEIGPGRGALTERLRRQTDRLILVEIDSKLAGALRERYRADAGVVVVEDDVMTVDFGRFLGDRRAIVVGNLPYNIGSQIVLRLVEERRRFSSAVVMLQDEVARRITAKPGTRDYGILTVLVQLYAEAERCFGVSRRSFAPPPNVASAVLSLRFSRDARFPVRDTELLRTIVRIVFQQRRKMIRSTLSRALVAVGVAGGELASVLEAAEIEPTARPEQISVAQFAALSNEVVLRRS